MARKAKAPTALSPVRVQTLAEVQRENLENILYSVQRALELYEDSKKKFLANCAEDPLYAMSWGSDFVRYAAEMDAWQWVKNLVTENEEREGLTVRELRAALVKDVLSHYTPCSSSALSNVVDLAKQEAIRGIARDLEYMAEKEEKAALRS